MEKLIELLNKFEAKLEEMPLAREKWREENWILYRRFMSVEDAERMVISKSFWFIKRLVQNDKIDRDKILKENWLFRKYFYDLEYVKNYDRLVMWLSVEDNPTKFLISYLK